MGGKLFVVGTPIGNLDDVTYRAVDVFASVSIVVCEDTRVTSRLVNSLSDKHEFAPSIKYISYNDFNAKKQWKNIVDMIESGEKIALVSDAGMPTLSDPGYRVIRGCYDCELDVEIIPGVSSITTALTASGLGGESFIFVGFLPKKIGKRTKEIVRIKEAFGLFDDLRVVLFVTPHRLIKDLNSIAETLGGNCRAVLMREMTKKFEERFEGSVSELRDLAGEKKLRGEMVLVISK